MIDEYKLKRTLRKLVVLMNNLQFKSMDQFFKEEKFTFDEIFEYIQPTTEEPTDTAIPPKPQGTVTKEEVEELVKANVNPKEMNKKVLAKEVKPTKPEVI